MPKRTKPPKPPKLGKQPPAQGKPPRPTQDEQWPSLITHDAFFKRILLTNLRRVRAFFRRFLPRKIAAHLANRLPVLLDTQHVSANLRTRRSDLVFQVFLKDGGFIYVVVEHKSARDDNVLRQLYRYYTSLLDRISEEVVQALGGDPVIVTLLVYHGPERWDPVVTLDGEKASQAKAKLDELTLDDFRHGGFRSIFIDLKEHEIADLTDDKQLQAALATMAYKDEKLLTQILERLLEDTDHRITVLTYMVQYWNIRRSELEQAMEDLELTKGGQEVGELAREIWEEGWEGGREEGIEEGIDLGREKGLAEAKAEWLVTLLQDRFGRVPKSVKGRIAQASVEELDAWFDRARTAETLESVFEGKR